MMKVFKKCFLWSLCFIHSVYGEFPDSVVGVVKINSLKDVVPTYVNVLKKVINNPQLELFPLMCLGGLGYPDFDGLVEGSSVSIFILDTKKNGNVIPIFVLRIEPDALLDGIIKNNAWPVFRHLGWTIVSPFGEEYFFKKEDLSALIAHAEIPIVENCVASFFPFLIEKVANFFFLGAGNCGNSFIGRNLKSLFECQVQSVEKMDISLLVNNEEMFVIKSEIFAKEDTALSEFLNQALPEKSLACSLFPSACFLSTCMRVNHTGLLSYLQSMQAEISASLFLNSIIYLLDLFGPYWDGCMECNFYSDEGKESDFVCILGNKFDDRVISEVGGACENYMNSLGFSLGLGEDLKAEFRVNDFDVSGRWVNSFHFPYFEDLCMLPSSVYGASVYGFLLASSREKYMQLILPFFEEKVLSFNTLDPSQALDLCLFSCGGSVAQKELLRLKINMLPSVLQLNYSVSIEGVKEFFRSLRLDSAVLE